MYGIKELRDKMLNELNYIYPELESLNLVNWLFLSVAGIEKKEINLDPGRLVDEKTREVLLEKLSELKAHKPIQYVTGTAYFYDLELEVSPAVLIPRPETEELVKWVSEENNERPGLKVLDIGTGSGCLILAFGKLLKDPELTAIDISEDALHMAKMNAAKYRTMVSFNKTDILEEEKWNELGNFDLIVSNPPYVRESEKIGMRANVLDYEPSVALFVPDNDPLLFYRAIARFSKKHLSEKGRLYLEINENLGKDVIYLLEDDGFSEIVLKKDMQGKDRMVRCISQIKHNRHIRTQ